LLAALAGTWKLEVYQHGKSTPVLSGRREMRLVQDSSKLAWTEIIGADTGSGVLGYNITRGSYYLFGTYAHAADPIILSGRADTSTGSITFDLAPAAAGVITRPGLFVTSKLRLIDIDHFEWTAQDGKWRAVFTRA
jgi:hypothetical protein